MRQYYHGSSSGTLEELSTNHGRDGRVYVTDSKLVALTYGVRTFPNLFTTLQNGKEGFLEIIPNLFERMTKGKTAYIYELEQGEYTPVVQNNQCGHGHCYSVNHNVKVVGKEHIKDAYEEFLKYIAKGEFVVVKKEDIPQQQFKAIISIINNHRDKFTKEDIDNNPILSLFFGEDKE